MRSTPLSRLGLSGHQFGLAALAIGLVVISAHLGAIASEAWHRQQAAEAVWTDFYESRARDRAERERLEKLFDDRVRRLIDDRRRGDFAPRPRSVRSLDEFFTPAEIRTLAIPNSARSAYRR